MPEKHRGNTHTHTHSACSLHISHSFSLRCCLICQKPPVEPKFLTLTNPRTSEPYNCRLKNPFSNFGSFCFGHSLGFRAISTHMKHHHTYFLVREDMFFLFSPCLHFSCRTFREFSRVPPIIGPLRHYSFGHGSKPRTPSEHPNPHSNRLKWVVNSPTPKWDPIGVDNHGHFDGTSGSAHLALGHLAQSGGVPWPRRHGLSRASCLDSPIKNQPDDSPLTQ